MVNSTAENTLYYKYNMFSVVMARRKNILRGSHANPRYRERCGNPKTSETESSCGEATACMAMLTVMYRSCGPCMAYLPPLRASELCRWHSIPAGKVCPANKSKILLATSYSIRACQRRGCPGGTSPDSGYMSCLSVYSRGGNPPKPTASADSEFFIFGASDRNRYPQTSGLSPRPAMCVCPLAFSRSSILILSQRGCERQLSSSHK